jgi:hypothetical protein
MREAGAPLHEIAAALQVDPGTIQRCLDQKPTGLGLPQVADAPISLFAGLVGQDSTDFGTVQGLEVRP